MPTLGELQAAGYHGLDINCRRCRCTVVVLWQRLRQPWTADLDALKLRLRCQQCGTTPKTEDVLPYYHDTSRAHARKDPPGPACGTRGHGGQSG